MLKHKHAPTIKTFVQTTISSIKYLRGALKAAGFGLAMLTATPAISTAQTAYRPGDQVVQIDGGLFGGGRALLHLPRGKPSAAVVLVPGGDGAVGIDDSGSVARDGNWIVRTRRNYAASGIASLLIDAGANPGAAVTFMRGIAPKVVIVAMSRGSTRVPQALSAKPDGVVFASSMLDQVRQGIGAPSALPPTLVIHHRRDECPVTHFSMAGEFMAWAGSRARLVWIDGGTSQGRICAGRAYHGFVGREGAVVGAITGFMRGLR